MDQYKSRKKGVTYVSEEGFSVIKNRLSAYISDPISPKINASYNLHNDETAIDTNGLSLNEDMIKALISQLKVKDQQLVEKSNQLNQKDVQLNQKDIQIGQLHNLMENSQVLLKEKPHQDVLQLEEHFQDLDNKLIEIKDKMQNKDQEHKGFFKNIFKK
jgi:uncharacterized protein (DUF3084 family)